MINAKKLSKVFNNKTAVNGVNINVPKGQIFGLLGPNASGKTTTIRLLCGIYQANQGEVKIDGKDVSLAKNDFGYVAQYFGQYEELTVWENIVFYAQMYNVTDQARLLSLLERYQLAPFKNEFSGALSGGYQRRLALVCALAHDPKVLFLDEPTAGIDPVTRKLLWDDFYRLSTEGKTLFVTTHYMEEAQRCHQLAFLSAGNIVAEGTPQTIQKALGNVVTYSGLVPYLPTLKERLSELEGLLLINQFGDELRLVVEPSVSKKSLEQIILETTHSACQLSKTELNLEDVFIALTQQG